MNFISVICPVFNEEKYIENILAFFVKANPENKEIFIVDGGSSDKTIEIVNKWSEKYNNIKLLHNPDKYVPYALNLGIKNCKGDKIIRLDAHAEYADDYFLKIIETFNSVDADIVGGPMNPVGKTDLQKAIAAATASIFGIGDSKFHDINHKGYVDSVYLGAWKKQLFDEIGFFDTKMIRNQDDEFHYRAKSLGKRIYLNPDIKSIYYPRSGFKSLFKQYFQYGLYKPLVLKKIKSGLKLRHLIPAFFVIYLEVCITTSYKFPIILTPLILYILFDIYFSFFKKNKLSVKIFSLAVYPILHISYGLGFLSGLTNMFIGKKNFKV